MLDLQLLRRDLDAVVARLERRKTPQPFFDAKAFADLESQRKHIQTLTESLQAKRNAASKEIGALKSKGQDTSAVMQAIAGLGEELQQASEQLDGVQARMQDMLGYVPNLPHDSVPVGADETGNVEVRRVGAPQTFEFQVKDHVAVGKPLGLDAETGAMLSGSRFTFLRGPVARLHRALAQFMLDMHTQQHGYTECYTPYIVNRNILEGTRQLPKFKSDMFWVYRGTDADEVARGEAAPQQEQYLIANLEW
jgi:seryl-tRNA synthetase